MEQCKSISQDHLHCLLLFSSAAGQRGRGWRLQTDRQIEQMAHTLSLPINLWLSLQLFLTCTRWPNHRATPKPIWLGNSHRWQFVPGMPPEQHTNRVDTQIHTTAHLLMGTLYTQNRYMHTQTENSLHCSFLLAHTVPLDFMSTC